MENVRCLIADIPQTVLADIVFKMAKESNGMEAVDYISNIEELPNTIQKLSIDVLILGMKGNDLPQICTDLMDRINNLMVVGLIDDGRRLAVYINNAGKKEIIDIITTFGKR